MGTPVTLDDIRAARAVTSAVAKHTPIVTSTALTEQAGGDVVLKAESLQRTGAFKIRGAMNKLASLGDGGGQRRDGGERRQPRPGAGVRRAALRRAVRHLRAGRRADHQDRGLPGVRRRGRRGRCLARRGVRRGTASERTSGAWRSATRSTTPPWWPGRARSGSSSSRTCRTWRASSCRWAAAGWPPARRSPSSRCSPTSGWSASRRRCARRTPAGRRRPVRS